ncbi:ATP-dependent DNA helicase PIF1 [Rhizophagus irregularis DAOM 181602=DAOM 197198]|nr:ATP-dependent DNA helicase PIF1 [Rhizophagus irregularis DAOM 181602=DAOM 197198]
MTTRFTKNKPQYDVINYLDITEIIYNSLTSLKNVNEFYEGENEELSLAFNIELSSFHDAILENNESDKENIEHEIGHRIINSISEDDGYSWVYYKKIQKENSFHIIYYCNCRIELGKRRAKYHDLDKQRDTPAYLERYHCEGIINIEIFSNLNLINVEYSHKMLHFRPKHVKTTLEIKNFIQDNLNCSVSEIFHQIQENHINGYENITVQQTYYWWSIESHKTYCRDPDLLLSTKYLLEEFNQEIILDNLNTSMPALGFLTVLFYQLLYNKFDAIEIDATYNTNNLVWELYAIMGVINGTGFPLSYLLISTEKNRNITGVLIQWMQALKERNLKDTPYILTDKDFAEINAAQTVWPETHLQLCVWHIQRAIKQRLSSNKTSFYHSYNPKIAHEDTFTTNANEIWKECVGEIIQFCKNNDLLRLWFIFGRSVNSVEKVDGIFFKKVQRNGNYPLISSYEGELVNVFCLENTPDHTILNIPITQDTENEDNYIIESDDKQHMYETDLNYLQEILNKTKELLEESHNKSKLKNICSNFNLLEKMNNDIVALENCRIMLRTWKDFNKNIRYWE